MKLLKIALLSTAICTYACSQTTMCFKKNHTSLETIEDTKLDGGECKSLYSLNEMKSQNWQVEDIKISNKNDKYDFIYILKRKTQTPTPTVKSVQVVPVNTNINEVALEAKIIKKLEAKEKQRKKEKELEEKIIAKNKGKELYTKKCASCHGQKGEKKVHPKAKTLDKMSYEDMKFAIAQYTNDFSYGHSRRTIMRPYAQNIGSLQVKYIKGYLDSLK